jgi:hypothetical protein
MATYTNSRIFPDLHTATIGDMFNTESKKPGWDLKELNWHWFIEIKLVNESDTPVTVEEFEVRVRVKRQAKTAILLDDLGKWDMDMTFDDQATFHAFTGERYREIPGLTHKIKNRPLSRGVGHRGWIHIFVKQISQREIKRAAMDMWIIDALEGRHEVEYKKKNDQKMDRSFLISEKINA